MSEIGVPRLQHVKFYPHKVPQRVLLHSQGTGKYKVSKPESLRDIFSSSTEITCPSNTQDQRLPPEKRHDTPCNPIFSSATKQFPVSQVRYGCSTVSRRAFIPGKLRGRSDLPRQCSSRRRLRLTCFD